MVQQVNKINMYDTNDILSELFNVLGLSKEDIKIIRDEYKDSVVNKNKNENSIKQSDTPKKPQPEQKIKLNTSEPRDGYVNVVNPTDYDESPKSETEVTAASTGPQTQQIAKDVLSIGDTYFELNKHVGDAILGGESIKIEFEDTFEGMAFPGITEKQLLWVLYVRYMKKDPKKISLVKQLLATEF